MTINNTLLRLVTLFLGIVSTAQGFVLQQGQQHTNALPFVVIPRGGGSSSSSSSSINNSAASSPASDATTTMEEVKVGFKIPSCTLQQGLGNFEKKNVDIAELIAGKKGTVSLSLSLSLSLCVCL